MKFENLRSSIPIRGERRHTVSLRNIIVMLVALCAIAAFAGGAKAASSATADSSPSAYTFSLDNGAEVVNSGKQVGDNCSVTTIDSYYSGVITHLVATSSGHLNMGCNVTLKTGPGVDKTTIFNSGGEQLVITPGDVANISLHS
ncbi:hypothetical protein KW801_00405 [Candidatus Saccharibacteria bacterium]|nr:hypothetical protein [Candidatus Saccharibacteria bacterium]